MVAIEFVLASASPARLGVLTAAGINPTVMPAEVDEEALIARLESAQHSHVVSELAAAKAHAVVPAVTGRGKLPAVIIGCDSMLSVDGKLLGKPHTPENARSRWQQLSGNRGELLTGHCVLLVSEDSSVRQAAGVGQTTVFFGKPSDNEIESYIATGEPLAVAGAFTLDAKGGWFIDRIEGDPSSVIGISLPLVRALLHQLGLTPVQWWPS